MVLWRRGVTYSLRPSQIAYMLPGGGYTEEDLRAIAAAADAACADGKLMELAWEVRAQRSLSCNAPRPARRDRQGSCCAWRPL